MFVKVGAPNDYGTAFVGWFDDDIIPNFKIFVCSPFFFGKICKFETFVEVKCLNVYTAFFDKEVDGRKLAVRCPIRVLRFEQFEFVSLKLVERFFVVMKMHLKFDTAKKFFSVPFNVEFVYVR